MLSTFIPKRFIEAAGPLFEREDLLELQNTETGAFTFDSSLLTRIFPDYAKHHEAGFDAQVFMTIVAIAWIKKYHNESRYKMILFKARRFLATSMVGDSGQLEESVSLLI